MAVIKAINHEDRLSLIEHLEELRSRLIVCIIVFVAAFSITYWQNDWLLHTVNRPLEQSQHLDGEKKSKDPLEQAATYDIRAAQAQQANAKLFAQIGTTLGTLATGNGLNATEQALVAQTARLAAAAEKANARAVAAAPTNRSRLPVTLGVTEPFLTTFSVAAYGALLLSLPLLLYQAYAFILPAFNPRERRAVLPLMLMVPVLFIAGVAFGYFVALPRAIDFLQNFNDDSFDILIRAQDYYKFSVILLALIGLMFQIPVGVLAVTRLGIVTAKQLAQNRGYVLIGVAVVAAVATPTPDPVTMIVTMAPLVVLYEISVLLARIFERRRSLAVDDDEDDGGGWWGSSDDDDEPKDPDGDGDGGADERPVLDAGELEDGGDVEPALVGAPADEAEVGEASDGEDDAPGGSADMGDGDGAGGSGGDDEESPEASLEEGGVASLEEDGDDATEARELETEASATADTPDAAAGDDEPDHGDEPNALADGAADGGPAEPDAVSDDAEADELAEAVAEAAADEPETSPNGTPTAALTTDDVRSEPVDPAETFGAESIEAVVGASEDHASDADGQVPPALEVESAPEAAEDVPEAPAETVSEDDASPESAEAPEASADDQAPQASAAGDPHPTLWDELGTAIEPDPPAEDAAAPQDDPDDASPTTNEQLDPDDDGADRRRVDDDSPVS